MVQKDNGGSLPLVRCKKYHKRSPWACDECRLRKKKCDGGRPCGPCKSTENVCTYNIRRPAQAPTQRIRSLEQHVRYASSFLKQLEKKLPPVEGVDIGAALKILDFSAPAERNPPLLPNDEPKSFRLSSMVTGCDQVVTHGPWSLSFYGATSGFAFIMQTIELFQEPGTQLAPEGRSIVAGLFDAPLPPPEVLGLNDVQTFPAPSVATALVEAVFARCHPLLQFLEHTDFRDMLTHIYDDISQRGASNERSISLLHFVLALGYLFSIEFHQVHGCEAALREGTRHFLIGSKGLNLLGSHDLLFLQTCLCAILFLLSTCRLVKARSLIGTASSSALKLGLHTSTANIGVSENQIRVRMKVFAAVVKTDTYTSLILGLPPFIRMQDIEVNMTNLLSRSVPGVQPSSRSKAAAMHFDLLRMTVLSRDSIFPMHSGQEEDYVDPQHLIDIEKKLRIWTKDVSRLLANETNKDESTLVKHELEMTYHFAQMFLFRPFLHYLRIMADGGSITLDESQHALACIKVASMTIVRSEAMMSREILPPASWTSLYSLFLSVMCLVFLISAHHGTSQPSEAWKKAATGIRVLAAHRCVDSCATACLNILRLIVRQLSHTVKFDFDQIESSTPSLCNRHRPSAGAPDVMERVTPGGTKSRIAHVPINQTPLGQKSELASPLWQSDADKILAQAEEMSLLHGFDIEDFGY